MKPGNAGGAKGETVNGETMQLSLNFCAADSRKGLAEAGDGKPLPATEEAPRQKSKQEQTSSAMVMEEVAKISNLRAAFEDVARNRGTHGIDGRGIEDVRVNLERILKDVSRQLLDGSYRPEAIRRVWIPKGGGGKRGLGIPTVVDRMVQQGVLRVLQPHFDDGFDPSSHGFRPKRSCHTALREAKEHVEAGYSWVLDIDLEKFFDTVNHQRLMSKLENRIEDRRLLRLILKMLQSKVVLPDGVVIPTTEGAPQGSPLSPLLSNIVLTELDEELRKRGHRFVRYADDCNVYVRSRRAGERVMESLSCFIEKRMRLKVNCSKSAVAETGERHFLGFRLMVDPYDLSVKIGLSERSRKRMAKKVRELTPRNLGHSLEEGIKKLNSYLKGWSAFFSICDTDSRFFSGTDAHIRRRLRAIQLKQWKRKRVRWKQMAKRGVTSKAAGNAVYGGSRALWALSIHPTVHRVMPNSYFENLDLFSLHKAWKQQHSIALGQLKLFA